MDQKRDHLDDLLTQEHVGPVAVDAETIQRMVQNKIVSADTERKVIPMKRKKKTLRIAIAAALAALSITAYAASGRIVSINGSSYPEDHYRSLPTESQVRDDLGYDAIVPETLGDGYVFVDGDISHDSMTDEAGMTVERFKTLYLDYEKDGDVVYFVQRRYVSGLETNGGEVIGTVDGVDLCYYSYENRGVAEDHQLTEEELLAEENGVVFSYGIEMPPQIVQGVYWQIDDMDYDLFQMGGQLSAEELAAMATEIIQAE